MLRSAAFLLALAATGLVQADTLCSLPPVTYAKAKTAYPASAFAIEALEKYGIATWYSDRKDNGDYAQTAANLVSSCPEDSRISVVVHGLPNKNCAAKESAVGSTVQSASDYVAFLNTLTSTIGKRKVLYILEPDAIGLLADTTACGQSAGYLANLQTAISLLSQNENAKIYLDVGNQTLENPATSTAVTDIVKQLATAGSKVKGISLNTFNYQSSSKLSTLCSSFQSAIGSTDLHCIFDTSRNRNGGNEWCNVKSAGIGALPTDQTGIRNVDYFLWGTPPGVSDGTCQGHTADSIPGPGAGVFFNELFQSLWNQGILVVEKGYPSIDGMGRSLTPSASANQEQQSQDQNEERQAVTYNATAPPNSSKTSETLTPASPIPVSKAQQVSTESSRTSTMGTGVIIFIALVAAAVVALAVIVGIRRRQKKMVNAAKTPELSALAPLPTTIVDFRPHIRTTPARDSNIL
ncbi:glycoside hydrolase, putative [Phytophthora infestans T30-4]|uniref:Glycoside hydrolase, putative n=1 Tax=Phytophthora infestans (strain T30-4) TaxID=403677 RepID=D0NXX1_PHYIT|nr:glycoside hydrolase, putative [Phytophthora infestans T30-4]EEY67922.1 glycoside hydrolase, putative [Phytophthora infestans T30-4]|eukprot:XP_002997784.1 glycoside hydrolase, putative [Phytophthora infestans T30-4]